MMNIFYKIWADIIVYEQTENSAFRNWKFYSFTFMSVTVGVNLATLLGIFIFLTGINARRFAEEIHILHGNILNNLILGITLFYIPSFILNYFLIFYKDKYKSITKMHKYKNGRLAMIYFFLSFILLFAIGIINKFN